ncbi:hypothetical protein B0H17DRAFT_1326382 [Mycena rosella]|uniref:Transmembrane protein n=1 Tax=Mycena rosella TaxID=1033263 RepID=A0AAD7GTK4_MYCRO|nr:hypothetical protein B0H17DRAFT_1326382 [Mycena rosella]
MSVIVDDRDPQYLATTTASINQGDTATFTFEGTSVGVFATVGSGNGGTMEFSIDQSPTSSFTAIPATSALHHQPLWVSGPLSGGPHTLSITQGASGNQSSVIFLDYFLYETNSTFGKLLFIDDNSPRVVYSSGWSLKSGDGNFNQTSHASTSAGSWVSLTFEGNFISVNGPITFGTNGGSFNAAVAIDGAAPVPITTQSIPSLAGKTTFNNALLTSLGLDSGSHTINITTLDDHPFSVDFFTFTSDSDSDTSESVTSGSVIPTASPSLMSSQSSRSLSIPAIIGGVVGGFALLVFIIIGVLLWRQRARELNHQARQSFQTSVTSRWTERRAQSEVYLSEAQDDGDPQTLRSAHNSMRKPRPPPQIVYC